MTTNWQIFDTKYQIADGLVTEVTYACVVKLEDLIDRTIGRLELTGDASVEGFVPYSELTPEAVIAWVKASLGEETVNSIETSLQSKVTARKAAKDNETQRTGLPWRN